MNKHLFLSLCVTLCALSLTSTPARAQANTFTGTGSVATERGRHTATLLPNGKVLIAGGLNYSSELTSAELYDPATGRWAPTGSLATERREHTATLLPNGKVLVVGGANFFDVLASAELYDPATGIWMPAGSLAAARQDHTATLLPTGKVLVVGGRNTTGGLATAELYDPATGVWAPAASISTAREGHTATMLRNGYVLVAGGGRIEGDYLDSAELYDYSHDVWSATGSMSMVRNGHSATLLPNGEVAVLGGTLPNSQHLTESYLPSSGTWAVTGSEPGLEGGFTATLLPNLKVLVTGGMISGGGISEVVKSAYLYDTVAHTWSETSQLSIYRLSHTATLLPGGKVLVVAGFSSTEPNPQGVVVTSYLATSELYDSASGSWAGTAPLTTARSEHTSTLLPDGQLLVAGGVDASRAILDSAEVYNPATSTWANTGSLATARAYHSATLLASGKVLVLGGQDLNSAGISYFASAELYNSADGTWAATGSLAAARSGHTTTLLANGKVLVAGGSDNISALASAEVYDPATGIWTPTGSLATARQGHTATLLPNGKVLVTGGADPFSFGPTIDTAELYDPASGTWAGTGSLGTPRTRHTATLLPSGQILVAGGHSGGGFLATAELYDHATGTWAPTGSLATSRIYHSATLLTNGTVLVAGGANPTAQASAEIYDPATGTWVATGSLSTARYSYTPITTLLPNGKVLISGGAAELYNVGLGFSSTSQPIIGSATFDGSDRLVLTGTKFLGLSTASSGNGSQDSPTNYPVVQLRRLDNEQCTFLRYNPSVNVSATSFTSLPVFPVAGYGLATVFTNGIPSASVIVNLAQPTTPTITWANPANISYGTALSGTQLNATASVPGTFVYTPASGSVLNVGNAQSLSVAFTPTDTVNYTGATKTVTINVSKATPTVSWANPADIIYGTAVGATQLNATASVPGSFVYTPASGTVLTAGNARSLSVTFTPTDTTKYNNSTKGVSINVAKATPAITWANPADITYGTALSPTQLNASASVPGTLVYTPAAGTIPGAGNAQTLSATFTPTDSSNYATVTNSVLINVSKATPTMTWSNPADITYGTALSATQLNASSSVPGTFVYAPAAGTIVTAGNAKNLSVTFTPTDTANYAGATKSVTINVAKATPTITWSNPAAVSYGAALGATQLNATASVPGSLVYTPAAGTILNTGVAQSLSANFTPTDSANYNTATKSVTIDVAKATATIAWPNPSDITYGTKLDAAQLNATASVPGTLVYTPASGTVLNAANAQSLSVEFTPTDATNYDGATKSITINVLKAVPTVAWASPADITYGTALNATQLNATSSVAGTFVYTPAAGTILSAGNARSLSVTFTPADTTNYASATNSAAINVSKATPTLTWTNPVGIGYGTALGSTQLDATASVPGTFVYTPPVGTILNAGSSQSLSVTFTPTDASNYNTAAKSVSISVSKATPMIAWANPADITYGAALGTTQLNAIASAPGTLVYSPAVGAILNAGAAQALALTFTPTDSSNYTGATKSVSINVSKANTSTGMSSSVNPSEVGQSVTFTASVSSNAGTPSGTVQFKDNGASMGVPVALGAGATSTYSSTALSAATHAITAEYGGDGNFNASSGTLAGGQSVTPAPTPTPTPTATPTPTPTPTATPTPTLSPTITPTPTASPSPNPSPSPSASPTATPAQAMNISTRVEVGTGDKVMIGGFIVTGNAPKRVIVRGIGPSLASKGITNPLADPVIELHGSDGSLILRNDNWRDAQATEIQNSKLAPDNDLEAAIIATLQPGAYTAIVSGQNGATGTAVVEIYDLDLQPAQSRLANISTRGFVQDGQRALIGGFMLRGNIPSDLAVRALGPSLSAFGVTNVLADPTVDVRNANGDSVGFSDDWATDAAQATALSNIGLAPNDLREAALRLSMPAGDYTVIAAGKSATTGVALVEIYNLGQ